MLSYPSALQSKTLLCMIASTVLGTKIQETSRPNALIYRDSSYVTCGDCAETIGRLLESVPPYFNVLYAGPNDIQVNENTLNNVTLFVFPGRPDLAEAYETTKHFQTLLRDWVASGGRYLGFCLGAYLAGNKGYGLMPEGSDALSEIQSPKSPVKDDKDTVVQVDWSFRNGSTKSHQWLYFQEGAYMTSFKPCEGEVIARYTESKNIAASVTKYGKGWVGLTGPHPEADQTWYDYSGVENPDGINRDFFLDLLAATLNGGKIESVGA